jgi:hypothetical protein
VPPHGRSAGLHSFNMYANWFQKERLNYGRRLDTPFWYYRVRPLEKLSLTISALKVIEPSIRGLEISLNENMPLGDGFLIATALTHRIPVIVSNDQDIISKAPKYGLIVENPIPEEVKKKLAKYEVKK